MDSSVTGRDARLSVIRILLVEKDPDDVLLLKRMLVKSSLSFHLENVDHLSSAIVRAQAGDVNVVIMALDLPDAFGMEGFRRIRTALPRVPIVVLTGLDDEALAICTVQEGAQDYIIKGQIDGPSLGRALRYAIERQRLQTDLADEHEFLHSLIDNIPDQVYVKDAESRFVSVNSVTSRFFGVDSPNALAGKTDFDLFPHDLAARFFEEEQAILHGRQACVNRESAVTDVKGKTRWVLTTKVPLSDHQGRITGLLGINRDITERKEAELATQRLNEELEQRVIERTADLNRAVTRLEEHDHAREAFISNVSHELKTPLASMKLAVDNMLSGITGTLSSRARSYLQMIQRDCQRLLGTVGDILDVSRIEAGKMSIRQVRVPFAWFVQRTIDSLRIQSEENHLHMTVAGTDCGVCVACDPEKLERSLLNVIKNAIKFTPEGGAVDIRLHREGDAARDVVLDIDDSGIGIPAEHLHRVTERYYRVGEHISGTGLGLTIAKDIIALHGGALELASPPPGRPCGTRVRIRLPVVEPPTVLFVEGNGRATHAVGDALAAMGFRLVHRDVTEGLAGLPPFAADLVLLDLAKPSSGGVRLLVEARGNSVLGRLPMLAITNGRIEGGVMELLEGLHIAVVPRDRTPDLLMDDLIQALAGRRGCMPDRMAMTETLAG